MKGIKVANSERELELATNTFLSGVPDLSVTFDNTIIEDNRAFTLWTFTKSYSGVFGGIRPTGKKVHVSGYDRVQFDNSGKIAWRRWVL